MQCDLLQSRPSRCFVIRLRWSRTRRPGAGVDRRVKIISQSAIFIERRLIMYACAEYVSSSVILRMRKVRRGNFDTNLKNYILLETWPSQARWCTTSHEPNASTMRAWVRFHNFPFNVVATGLNIQSIFCWWGNFVIFTIPVQAKVSAPLTKISSKKRVSNADTSPETAQQNVRATWKQKKTT